MPTPDPGSVRLSGIRPAPVPESIKSIMADARVVMTNLRGGASEAFAAMDRIVGAAKVGAWKDFLADAVIEGPNDEAGEAQWPIVHPSDTGYWFDAGSSLEDAEERLATLRATGKHQSIDEAMAGQGVA